MHFIDFLLQLICLICWILKSVYVFAIDYVIPVLFGQIVPVLIKYLSQLFALLLRVFFTYISPCVIQLLNGTTFVFTRALNALSVASMTIIESDVNLEYAHAILMATILVVIIYFHITEKIARFIYGWYQIVTLYLRFFLSFMKMLRFCLSFSYHRISMIFSGRDVEVVASRKERKHHNHQRQSDTSATSTSSNGRKSM